MTEKYSNKRLVFGLVTLAISSFALYQTLAIEPIFFTTLYLWLAVIVGTAVNLLTVPPKKVISIFIIGAIFYYIPLATLTLIDNEPPLLHDVSVIILWVWFYIFVILAIFSFIWSLVRLVKWANT